MRLALLTALTMIAFAANSLLNRAALAPGDSDPAGFALVRLASGALVLMGLLALRRRASGARAGALPWRQKLRGAAMLAIYVLGFSFAYVSLDAGLGALLLFGAVQVTMFTGAILSGEAVPARRWAGAALAVAGLVWLLWPAGAAAPRLVSALTMLAAGVGWGLYSLIGRRVADPLAETAWSFALAVPAGAAVALVAGATLSREGAVLALVSGAVTSGLGYALWYRILPALGAARAAIAQLCVPVLALGAASLLLGEGATPRLIAASLLILGGVGVSLLERRTDG